MNKWFKVLTFVLMVFVAITLIAYVSPNNLLFLSSVFNLTDDQLSNILAAIDIALSFGIAIYTIIEQKRVEKRCQYDFLIEKDNLSFDSYNRYSTDIENAYRYDYCRKNEDGIKEPFYLVDIHLQKEEIASVGIPLNMQVITGLAGNIIEFRKLNISASKNGKGIGINYKNSDKFLEIVAPVRDEKRFLIRLKLLCDYKLQKTLQDSCIYISFLITLKDDRRRKYKKYIFLVIQNVRGETKILESDSSHSWLLYIRKLFKIKCSMKK